MFQFRPGEYGAPIAELLALAGDGNRLPLEKALREIQRVEWQLLFDFCCRRAVGAGR